MPELGNLIREAILQLLEGKLSQSDKANFASWLTKSRVTEYYLDRALSLESIVEDLQYLSKEWNDHIETEAWDMLKLVYKSQGINTSIDEAFPDFITFLQFQDARIDAEFAGHGDGDFLNSI